MTHQRPILPATLPSILLVDDEPHALASMRMALEDEFDCLTAEGAEQARAIMEDQFVQVVFCDQRMPGMTGVDFLQEVRERWPETVRIIITGYTETADMIAAINEAGIYQFLTKPWHPEQLLIAARNACQLFQLSRDHGRLSLEMRYLSTAAETKLEAQRASLRDGLGFDTVLRGPASPLNPVLMRARQFASFDVPVLLQGPLGVGKAQIARAMHYGSLRSERPFLSVTCAGLSDQALAAELFGARRGALPGLQGTRHGMLQKADRGTVCLEGVEHLSPEMQVALLRLLREGAFQPLGAPDMQGSGARIVATAHTDLRAAADQGRFSPELFHALDVAALAVPALAERACDIPLLAQTMLAQAAARHGKPVRGLSEAALGFLAAYGWPGNLPELENEITRMLIFAQEPVLGPELISRHILQAAPGARGAPRREAAPASLLTGHGSLKDRVEAIEARILRETLTRLKWNKSRAASELGLSRVGLRAKLDRYGVAPPRAEPASQTEEV